MDTRQLEAECRSYAVYLTGIAPGEYVISRYIDFHRNAVQPRCGDPFDRFLLDVSARGPFRARLADSYASRFRKRAPLRAKLALTLAILECVPPFSERLDSVPRGGPAAALVRLGWAAALYTSTLLLSTAFFAPVHIAGSVRPKSREAAAWLP